MSVINYEGIINEIFNTAKPRTFMGLAVKVPPRQYSLFLKFSKNREHWRVSNFDGPIKISIYYKLVRKFGQSVLAPPNNNTVVLLIQILYY